MAIAQLLSAPARRPFLTGTITYLTGHILSFTGNDAIQCTISEGASNGLLLGGAFASTCQLILNNRDEMFTADRTPYGAQVHLCLGAGEEQSPLIVFTVTKVIQRENDPRLTLQGTDALGTAFEGAFQDSFTYPRTLLQLAQGMAAQAGFTVNEDFPNASFSIPNPPEWGDISLRQALAHVACAAGCFACIDRQGHLLFRPVHSSMDPFTIAPENTLQRESGDGAFGPLQALIVRPKGAPRDSAPLVFAQDGANAGPHNTLTIDRNPLFPYQGSHTAALAQAALNALSGLAITGARVTWRGDPSLMLGDAVRILDAQGRATLTRVTAQSITFAQGFSMQSACTAPGTAPTVGRVFTASGALNAALLDGSISGVMIRDGSLAASALMAGSITAHQLAAQAVTAEKLQAGSVTSDKIVSGAVTADTLAAGAIESRHLSTGAINAVYAHLSQANIDWANIDSLTAAVAQIANAAIGTADIDWAKIKDLVSGRAIITAGEAGELYIARLAVTEANLVSLSVGELLIKGEDGGFYALTVNESGSIEAEKKLVENDDVENASIHGGQKLIEGSITAHTLNVQDIFGDSAIIRQLIAANLDADTLFARDAVIDKLNALDITGNESIRLYVQDQENLSAFLRVTEEGIEIGRDGDPALFRADNRTLDVTHVKTQRLGIARSMHLDEEWAWIATQTGLGLKYVGT